MHLSRTSAVSGLTVVGLAAVLAGLAWGQPAAKPRKVALLVGINTYDKRGFAEQPLQFAERDVTDLKKELEKAGFQVTLLTGSAKGPSVPPRPTSTRHWRRCSGD